jgi:hypothetical protein
MKTALFAAILLSLTTAGMASPEPMQPTTQRIILAKRLPPKVCQRRVLLTHVVEQQAPHDRQSMELVDSGRRTQAGGQVVEFVL